MQGPYGLGLIILDTNKFYGALHTCISCLQSTSYISDNRLNISNKPRRLVKNWVFQKLNHDNAENY